MLPNWFETFFQEVTLECKIRMRSYRQDSHSRKTVSGVVPPGAESTHLSTTVEKCPQQTCYESATRAGEGDVTDCKMWLLL